MTIKRTWRVGINRERTRYTLMLFKNIRALFVWKRRATAESMCTDLKCFRTTGSAQSHGGTCVKRTYPEVVVVDRSRSRPGSLLVPAECSSNSCARTQWCMCMRVLLYRTDGKPNGIIDDGKERRAEPRGERRGGHVVGTANRVLSSRRYYYLYRFACTARGMFSGRRRAGAHALLADEDIFFSMYVYVVYVIRRDSKHERRRRGERYGRQKTCTRACARQD